MVSFPVTLEAGTKLWDGFEIWVVAETVTLDHPDENFSTLDTERWHYLHGEGVKDSNKKGRVYWYAADDLRWLDKLP